MGLCVVFFLGGGRGAEFHMEDARRPHPDEVRCA